MKEFEISGEIGWNVRPVDIKEFLKGAKGEDISVTISTPGGLVGDGFEIYNLLSNYKGRKTAVFSGYVMSIGSYISTAFDEIACEDNAVFMIHNASGGVFGDHNDILKYGDLCKRLSGVIATAYQKKSGIGLEEISKKMDSETFYFGKEIVEAGFADRMISTDSGENKESATARAVLAFSATNKKIFEEGTRSKDLDRAAIFALGNMDQAQPKPVEPKNENCEVSSMNLSDLKAKHPDLVEAVVNEAKADFNGKIAEAKAEAKSAEIERIKAVYEQSYPGFEEIVAAAMFDGKTTAGDVAMRINQANLKREKTAMNSFRQDAPKPVEEQSNEESEKKMSKKDAFKAKWEKMSREEKAEYATFDLFVAFHTDGKGFDGEDSK